MSPGRAPSVWCAQEREREGACDERVKSRMWSLRLGWWARARAPRAGAWWVEAVVPPTPPKTLPIAVAGVSAHNTHGCGAGRGSEGRPKAESGRRQLAQGGKRLSDFLHRGDVACVSPLLVSSSPPPRCCDGGATIAGEAPPRHAFRSQHTEQRGPHGPLSPHTALRKVPG